MDRKVDKVWTLSGVTLVEILVLLAIVLILAGVVIAEIQSFLEKARLRQALNQFLSDLNFVKNQAQITGVAWGIRACTDSGKYKIFIDHDGNCRDSYPNCDTPSSLKVCVNNLTQNCNGDADCYPYFQGNCRPIEQVKVLDAGFTFVKNNSPSHFYVVFDRKGFPFDYICGLSPNNVTIKSPSGKENLTVIVDRFGRVRVE